MAAYRYTDRADRAQPRTRTYECLVCTGRFHYAHHPWDSPPPANCPLCGASTSSAPVFEPTAPAIRGIVGIAADQVYRSMEASSEARAQVMAEVGGGGAADYSHTKITDMNDQMREGDVATRMTTMNPVRAFMDQNARTAPVGSQPNSVAQSYAADAHQGYFPHAGDRSRSVVANIHGGMAAAMQRKGQMNKN